MPENNKHTDPIEELFRRKAEDYDISYNEADWQDMEKRLAALDEQIRYRNRRRWMIAASVLIFSLLGYFTYENRVQINQLTQQLNSETPPERQENPSGGDPYTHNPRETDEQSGGLTDQNENRNGNNSEPGNQANETASDQSSQPQEVPDDIKPGTSGSATLLAAEDAGRRELYISELNCSTCVVSGSSGNRQPIARMHADLPRTPAGTSTLADAAGITPLTTREYVPRQGSRLALSLIAGPDLSTVGSFSDFYDPGYKLGVTVEYNLTSKLNISTGVIQSDVRYRARGSEYRPPRGYWTDGIVPHETIGECILLDIPINLKYRFLDLNHSHVYIGVGLSSYIMQSEDYHFNYKENRSDLVQGWYGETGSRHWFSNAGFSIVYELDIHPNWSLRAEPFINMPLKEVGWGNVKLYSVGSFVSINFKL